MLLAPKRDFVRTARLSLAASLMLAIPVGFAQQGGEPFAGKQSAGGAPQLIREVKTEYPYDAVRKNMEGKVLLEVHVDERGVPKQICISEGNPPFAGAALNAVRQWRWEPSKKAKPFLTHVEIAFKGGWSNQREIIDRIVDLQEDPMQGSCASRQSENVSKH